MGVKIELKISEVKTSENSSIVNLKDMGISGTAFFLENHYF